MTHSKSKNPETVAEQQLAHAIRVLAIDAVEKAQSGHPGMPMGMADVVTVLFSKYLKYSPNNPKWPDRDRFVLSAGHGSMLLYALLYLTGYKDISLDDIKNFRQLNYPTAGHPEYGLLSGIETTTGPLGQGFANAVGMALAEKMMNARFGNKLVNHKTFAIVGDGCLMEGISHEAASIAGHLNLEKLIVLFDDNGITIDGPTSLAVSDNTEKRFNSLGWDVHFADGHDFKCIDKALSEAISSNKPSLIICKTNIAKGAPNKEGQASSHGAPLGKEEITGTKKYMNWKDEPFYIPENVLTCWKKLGSSGEKKYQEWEHALSNTDSGLKERFYDCLSGDITKWNIDEIITNHKDELLKEKPFIATRKASQLILEKLTKSIPVLIGGSADLSGSNNTKTASQKPITKNDFLGSYIFWGVREHGMAAALNGIALHGGFIPYAGTFLVFSDYCRPSIRLSALMNQRVIYIMTHDSIGLGEDGPTHQPIEHLSALRAIPNLYVFRPADALETAESWGLALKRSEGPSILALSRQNLPFLRSKSENIQSNLSSKGAYPIIEDETAVITLIGSGSEVSLAISTCESLLKEGIQARVVSVPCLEIFNLQDLDYIENLLGNVPRIFIEAGISQPWEKFIGPKDAFLGVNNFGASAPANELYKHFGLTVKSIIKNIKTILEI